MEDGRLNWLPAPADEWQQFLHGGAHQHPKRPAAVAWALEAAAVQRSWPIDHFMGSEVELMRRFGVTRSTLRQAIRIVESHGSMCMRRGRSGGLYLSRASVEPVAAALATYLCACGGTAEALDELAIVAAPLFAERQKHDLLEQLYERTLKLFTRQAETPIGDTRGAVIAMRLLTHAAAHSEAIPEQGKPLGSEAQLCERFNASRLTLRQALRIIDDLGMLRVRRGRGGGFLLQRPSPIGMIRQMFTLLASQQQSLQDIVPMCWTLNLICLRSSAQRLQANPLRREHLRDELLSTLSDRSEPQRWVVLQMALERTADAPLIGTLQRCLVSYQARLGSPNVVYASISKQMGELEDGIVAALCAGDVDGAESRQRSAQRLLSELLGCPDLPATEHAAR